MENATFEAINVAINIFVFIIALTVAMTLMLNINDIVEFIRLEQVETSSGNLVELYGDVTERTFTGADLYAFYGQIKLDQFDEEIQLKVDDVDLVTYIESADTNILENKRIFRLEQISENIYNFELIEVII